MIVGGQARAVLIDTIFVKTTKISSRARAGGKALTGESSSASQEQEDGEQSIEQIREALDKLQQSRKSSIKAPEEKDKADGISGDGTGWSNGRIITLMSIDTDRIDKAFGLFHIVWTSPLILIVALIMLLVNIGYSCLAGYALLIISLPLLSIAVKSLFRRRMKINKVTDQRVSLTQEILQAVRFVKYFSWESSFLNRLKELRAEEIRKIQVVQSIRNGLMCVALALPVFASMISFITYALSNHDLEAAAIFSSLAMFNTIRTPLNMLPLTISQLTDAIAALKRIQAFLLAEEREETITQDPSMENTVEIEDATFTWERVPTDNESEEQKKKKAKKDRKSLTKSSSPPPETAPTDPEAPPFKLENLSLTIHPNELLAIIGPVGCGKTSLLSALAGDMRLTTGTARMNASRAYCPQYAWIQNATIKQNILFGKPYDAEKYNAVIEACALKADIEMFTDGDETEIGERGVVLLDDPLSAVDAHVGRHIMDNAICGLLRNKIVLMDKGKIETIGTFEELMEGSEAFRRLMSTTAQEAGDQGEKNKADDGNEDETSDEDGIDSADDSDNNDDKPQGHTKSSPLMQQEDRGTNSVSWRIWAAYIRSFGRFPFLLNVPLIIFTLISANGANIITGLWLSWWTSNNFSLSQGQYMGLYAGLAAAQCLLMFTLSTTISLSTTNASRKMYAQAMERVLRAPMGFFDTTPLGRITNRFSKDIATMDNELTDTVRMAFLTVSMIISIIILIIVVFHWFALALVPLLILFTLATLFYRRSAQELKRHESVLRSTVFAQFSESLSGIPSIRAYNMQSHFTSRLRTSLDDMDSAYFLTFANQRWLSVRIDAVGNLMVFVTGILVVTSRFNVSPSTSGLVLSYILSIVSMLQFTVREVAELENNMNATERVYGYATALETEGEMFGVEVDREWPAQGRITFEDVQMRYRPGLPLVLKGLSMDVKGGEKIGIVGRTGAGKSSIMSALFRLSELSGGKISIDGVDISKVGLHDLRSRLAIIPQDPTLFRGTIRSNLDPFGEHTDLELWHSLRKAGLVDDQLSPSTSSSSENAGHTANNSPQSKLHLDSPVEEDGLNYSLGQRQLLALARALVRDSRIIICDEATSSVDFDTDARIQRTIAQGIHWQDAAVHRASIEDYYRV
ncbi:ABC transporter, transmembrane domain, type 1 [Ascosphaera apis ARSEF 7405]|uniref:ABC transporter, transmembrane domain, type 1 n=1 Tax=Ascosphaera apis ARSEF 7405 TaxID=392613 RepID=A0A167VGF0_9EURO|nr:ABC transporter, transmembrane domain, type 1 [Ascosphaera apis ARSEF 7405]